jgi:hypothetical protein
MKSICGPIDIEGLGIIVYNAQNESCSSYLPHERGILLYLVSPEANYIPLYMDITGIFR